MKRLNEVREEKRHKLIIWEAISTNSIDFKQVIKEYCKKIYIYRVGHDWGTFTFTLSGRRGGEGEVKF